MSAPLSQLRAMPRRGLSRTEAAAYVGVGETKFDELREDGRMPAPRLIDGRKVWDIRELDMAFDELPKDTVPTRINSWADR